MKYCENWSIPYEDDNYGNILQPMYEDLKINWRDDLEFKKGKLTTKLFNESLELLYDLIQAGLVEKVEE